MEDVKKEETGGEEEALKTWIKHFIKQKDLAANKIVSIEEEKEEKEKTVKLIVKYKDSEAYFFIIPEIRNEDFMRELSKDDTIGIVVLNKKSNLDFLVKNWKDFIEFPFLTFYFVNPESTTDVKWIVRPSVHNRIAEPKSLKAGLKAMFEMVEEVK